MCILEIDDDTRTCDHIGIPGFICSRSSGNNTCRPDKLVWDGEWQSSMLGMAGNHDLSTAWTKYADRPYGDTSMLTMKQTCWDVEGELIINGIKCDASFKGTVEKNVLSGTWTAPTPCGTKSESGRKFYLTMAADNKSWLGDFYSDGQDPTKFPPNWAGRRPVTK